MDSDSSGPTAAEKLLHLPERTTQGVAMPVGKHSQVFNRAVRPNDLGFERDHLVGDLGGEDHAERPWKGSES